MNLLWFTDCCSEGTYWRLNHYYFFHCTNILFPVQRPSFYIALPQSLQCNDQHSLVHWHYTVILTLIALPFPPPPHHHAISIAWWCAWASFIERFLPFLYCSTKSNFLHFFVNLLWFITSYSEGNDKPVLLPLHCHSSLSIALPCNWYCMAVRLGFIRQTL